MIDEEDVRRKMKLLRELRGLSQDAVASMAQISASTISRWESGKIKLTLRTFLKILNAINASVDDLSSETDAVVKIIDQHPDLEVIVKSLADLPPDVNRKLAILLRSLSRELRRTSEEGLSNP